MEGALEDARRSERSDRESQEPDMPNAATHAPRHRRLRAAAPHGRGGASSLLRLSRSAGTLPSGAALEDWATRAAALLDEPAPPLFTTLSPSPAAALR
jgi:hypothetical protein